MRIALDCRTVGSRMTGVGRYVWRLTQALLQHGLEHKYHVLFTQEASAEQRREVESSGSSMTFSQFTTQNHPAGDLWEQTVLPLWLHRNQIDLLVSGIFLSPFWSVRTRRAFVVHDMIAFLFPETMPPGFSRYVRFQTRWASRTAHGIIANSESTKKDLLTGVPQASGKVEVVYVGLETGPEPAIRFEWKDRIQQPFFLAVGTTEPRKNLLFLLDRFSEARQCDATLPVLLIVGQPGEEDDKIRTRVSEMGLQDSVFLMGYVEDDALRGLYAEARAFLYPSLYEGFGFPPLEAMRAGTPVVASHRGALSEVIGDAGLLFDPEDRQGWRDAILRVGKECPEREELIRRGRDRVMSFSLERTASMALKAFQIWSG